MDNESGSAPESSKASIREEDDSDTLERRPPLPPRPSLLAPTNLPATPLSSARRPSLQSKPTTALSSVDIQTLTFPDGTRGTFSTSGNRAASETIPSLSTGQSTPSRKISRHGSEGDDTASLMSFAPTTKGVGDLFSLLDEGLDTRSPAWQSLHAQADRPVPFQAIEYEDTSLVNFEHEFEQIAGVDSEGGNEG